MRRDPHSPYEPEPVNRSAAPAPYALPDAAWGDEPDGEIDVMAYVRLVLGQWKLVVGVTLVVLMLGLAWAMTRPERYRATAMMAFESSPQLVKSQISLGLDWWKMERYVLGQMEVLQTERLARRVADRLALSGGAEGPDDRQGAAAALLGSLRVERVTETDILKVSMVGGDAATVAETLNIYLEEFRQTNIEDTLERSQEVYRVIQNKLSPLQEQLERSEERLTSFQEREDSLLFASEDKNVISEQVNTLTTAYAEAKADRIKLETTIAALRELRAESIEQVSLPEIRADDTIRQLQSERGGVLTELNEQLDTYREGHPVIQDLRTRLESLNTRIEEQVQSIVASLRAEFEVKKRREAALYANIQQLKNQAIDLSKQSLEFEKLRREYEQNKSFLEEMLARSKEVDISSSADLNNVRIIEPARPPQAPFSPNIPRTAAVSLVLGMFLGIGLVLGLDVVDQTLHTPEDVEKYLDLDVLALFPDEEVGSSAMRESFQSLRTAVMMAARDASSQTLMVTSGAPEEGKTTVSLELARTLARGGASVLLVDADLRRPRLHREAGCDRNTAGLTTVALGEASLEQAVVAMEDRLDLLASGPLPPNPPELFSKSSFFELVASARAGYDWVILDTPPLMSVTDAVICSQAADMVLLVIQDGHLRRQVVREAVRHLARAGARVVGAVLNRVDIRRGHSYSYHYSYYNYGSYGEPRTGTKLKNVAG